MRIRCSHRKTRNDINCQTCRKPFSNIQLMLRHHLLDLAVLLGVLSGTDTNNLNHGSGSLVCVWGVCRWAQGCVTGIRTTPGCPLRGSVNLCSSAANCLCRCASAFWMLQQCCSCHRLLFASGSNEAGAASPVRIWTAGNMKIITFKKRLSSSVFHYFYKMKPLFSNDFHRPQL